MCSRCLPSDLLVDGVVFIATQNGLLDIARLHGADVGTAIL